MPSYAYRAVNTQTGHVQRGRLVAAHEQDLSMRLLDHGLELIEARDQKPLSFHKRPLDAPIGRLCAGLRDLMSAGVPFEEALSLCTDMQPSGSFRDALQDILRNIRAGSDVGGAFSRHGAYFDPVFVSLLKTGESSGSLAAAFDHLSIYLKDQAHVQRETRRALRYPLFLLALALGVASFMLLFVMPSLTEFLGSLNQTLPWTTRLLLALASAFELLWWVVPSGVSALLLSLILLRRLSDSATIKTDRWLLCLPVLGPRLHRLNLVRLMTCVTLLVKSGHMLPQALDTARASVSNRALAMDIEHARTLLVEGRSFSEAASLFLPVFCIHMIKVGEKSGQLTPALDSLTSTLAREAKEDVDRMLGLIEPALTLFVGGLMVWIILAVLGPVYSALAPLSQAM